MHGGQPTTVVIDGRKLGDGGIGTYIENLVDGLLELRDQGDIRLSLALLVPPAILRRVSSKVGASSEDCDDYKDQFVGRWRNRLDFVSESAGRYSVGEYALLAARQRKILSQAAVFHSPHYTLPFFLKIPRVVTIHDVIHVTHPENFYHRPMGKFLLGSALSRADQVITVSSASKLEIERNFSLNTTPCAIVPNALRREFLAPVAASKVSAIRAEFGLSGKYCLFVGSDRPHKGFIDLCRAWKIFLDELPANSEPAPKLVVVGERFSEKSKELVTELGLQQSLVFLGAVSNELLAGLYSGTACLLMPSQVEGFGLPALEAMACGATVVSRQAPSLKELCGSAAFFAIDDSVAALAAVLQDSLSEHSDSKRLEKCSLGQKIASKFSPVACAWLTAAVYEQTIVRAANDSRFRHQRSEFLRAAGEDIFPRNQTSAHCIAAATDRVDLAQGNSKQKSVVSR